MPTSRSAAALLIKPHTLTHTLTIPKADKFTNIKFTHTHSQEQGTGAEQGSTLKNESDNLTTYLVK